MGGRLHGRGSDSCSHGHAVVVQWGGNVFGLLLQQGIDAEHGRKGKRNQQARQDQAPQNRKCPFGKLVQQQRPEQQNDYN